MLKAIPAVTVWLIGKVRIWYLISFGDKNIECWRIKTTHLFALCLCISFWAMLLLVFTDVSVSITQGINGLKLVLLSDTVCVGYFAVLCETKSTVEVLVEC